MELVLPLGANERFRNLWFSLWHVLPDAERVILASRLNETAAICDAVASCGPSDLSVAFGCLLERLRDSMSQFVDGPLIPFEIISNPTPDYDGRDSLNPTPLQMRLPMPLDVTPEFRLLWNALCRELAEDDLLILGANLSLAAQLCAEIVSLDSGDLAVYVCTFRGRFGASVRARTLKPPLVFGHFSSEALCILTLWRDCYAVLGSIDREQIESDLAGFRCALRYVAYNSNFRRCEVQDVLNMFYHIISMDEDERLYVMNARFDKRRSLFIESEVYPGLTEELNEFLERGCKQMLEEYDACE